MAFFKTTRDQLKANGLMSHLEHALQQFRPHDMFRCEHHLHGAQKALIALRSAKAEYILSYEGWDCIVKTATDLQIKLEDHGFEKLARDLDEITAYGCQMLTQRMRKMNPKLFRNQSRNYLPPY